MTTTSKLSDSETLSPKLPFGIPTLDEALCGGIAPGALTVVIAPPGHCTTAFLIDACCRWAAAGRKVLLITDSMTEETHARLSANQQFQVTDRSHALIKYQPIEQDISFTAPLAGLVKVVSLTESGATLERILADVEEPPAMVLFDPGPVGLTEGNVRVLKDFTCERQARVLAVCSVERSSYGNKEGVFERFDARPEEFAFAVAKPTYADYAASAVLALQYAGPQAALRDGDGHDCKAMKLHLACVREGVGPVTVPMLVYPGSCRFVEDKREVSP